MSGTRARRARLQVEALEDRQLLAAHIMFNAADGIINVQGTPRNETVILAPARDGGIKVTLNGGGHTSAVFPRSEVKEVLFQGNGGHDHLINHTDVATMQLNGATNAARLRHGHPSRRPAHRVTNANHRRRKHATPAPTPADLQARGADGLTAAEELILQQTNATRVARGLPPLIINPLLQQAAEARALAEANSNTYYADGGFPQDIEGTGYNWSILGQNDAYNWGYSNPAQQLMNQWLASPPHLANMVDRDYVEVGIAVATSAQGNTFGVQCFGAQQA
jgi:uncharacterized protein YkwD